ncbi:MAG: hypothetical protein ACP5FT_02550 [Acidilobus sp.]
MSIRMAGLVIIALMLASLMLLATVKAQATLPFSISYNATRGVLNVGNLFYYVGFNLTEGGRAYFWWVNTSSPTLIPVIPYNTTKVPTPLIAIGAPNSSTVKLPGDLSSSRWTSSQVSSSDLLTAYELTANATLTAPFLVRVIEAFSPTSPAIMYTITVTNLGGSPAYTTIAYGIGAYQEPSSSWSAAALQVLANGSQELVKLTNGTALTSAMTAISVESRNGSPTLVIGLSGLPQGVDVEYIEGRVLGLSVNTTYLIAFFKTPVLAPGSNYSVTFEAFATGFNAYELGAVGASLPAYYLYPNYTSDVQKSMGVNNVIDGLESMIAGQNATISRLRDQVNSLNATAFWYLKQWQLTQRAEAYYMEAAHRGGLLAAGLFVAGIVLGVVGGAFFLSPSHAEAVAVKKGKGKGR